MFLFAMEMLCTCKHDKHACAYAYAYAYAYVCIYVCIYIYINKPFLIPIGYLAGDRIWTQPAQLQQITSVSQNPCT